MADPTQVHVTEADLEDLARGSAHESVEQHVAMCIPCRDALERFRRVGYYLAAPPRKGVKRPKDHLADQTLHALFNNGLSPARVETAAKHLQACDECLARYERVRSDELSEARPPQAAQTRAVDLPRLQRKLRGMLPPASRFLGRIVAHRAGSSVALTFEAADQFGRRLPNKFPTGPVRLSVGPFQIDVEPLAGAPGCLQFRALREGRPEKEAVLRAEGEALEMTARADADGRVRLPLCPGALRLELRSGGALFRLDLLVEG